MRSSFFPEFLVSSPVLRWCSQKAACSTHKTVLSREHSGARTPPVRYPFTRSSTSANAGLCSQWLEEWGWVSNNLNNFTIASAFARHSRNKLYPRNFKIDDRVADTCKSVRERNIVRCPSMAAYRRGFMHCTNGWWSTNHYCVYSIWFRYCI